MGLTYVTVKLTGLTGRKAIEEEFLVDTDAIDCLPQLRHCGALALNQLEKTSTNWQTDQWKKCHSDMPLFALWAPGAKVIFGPEGAEPRGRCS